MPKKQASKIVFTIPRQARRGETPMFWLTWVKNGLKDKRVRQVLQFQEEQDFELIDELESLLDSIHLE